jgi:hypothetical protein
MSRGAAGNNGQPLKIHDKITQHRRHTLREKSELSA